MSRHKRAGASRLHGGGVFLRVAHHVGQYAHRLFRVVGVDRDVTLAALTELAGPAFSADVKGRLFDAESACDIHCP